MSKPSKRIVDIEALEKLRSKKLKERNQRDIVNESYINGITESIVILQELDKEGK